MELNPITPRSGLSTAMVVLALAVPAGHAPAQDVQGWPVVSAEMVRQLDSHAASLTSRPYHPVVDTESFDRAAAAHGWPATSPELWEARLGQEVGLEVPQRVATETCRFACPYAGNPRIYRLMDLTRTPPVALSREIGELPDGHFIAVIRVESNSGEPGDRYWRSEHREFYFVLDAEAEGGPRIASMLDMVKLATGGPM